jgi:hypothetical protein
VIESNLPNPGSYAEGVSLRTDAAKAISIAETHTSQILGGRTQDAKTLSDFFTACVTALSTLWEAVVPTITSRVQTGGTQVDITFSENMDQTIVPPLSAFTSAGNTITGASWISATVLRLTGTGFAAAENLTYTLPAVNFIRDRAGNAVATSSANMT